MLIPLTKQLPNKSLIPKRMKKLKNILRARSMEKEEEIMNGHLVDFLQKDGNTNK